MNNNIILITGGTGGHVIPAINFANYLLEKKIYCTVLVDKRGFKYINNFKGKIHIIKSSNLNGNFFLKFFGITNILFGFITSLFLIISIKPNKVISFGSYASFPPMFCCTILKLFYKLDIFIHEQNSVLGRTNRFFFELQ